MPAALFDDYRAWPGDTLSEVPRSWWRDLNDHIIDRIGAMPRSYTAYPGQVMAVQGDGAGPTVAEENSGPIGFGLQPVRRFRPYSPALITGSVVLTDNNDCGSWLLFAPTSPINVTVGLNSNPASGAGDRFQVNMLRLFGAAEVTVVLGGGLV